MTTNVHESEVWCRRCANPSTETVNGEAYCHEHAALEHWKANSPSWNPERTITQTPAVAPETESERRAGWGDR